MSMLTSQIDELRDKARLFEGYQNGEISRMMREAAYTIESLRDRLQELQGVGCESHYSELFGTPERAAGFLLATIRMMGTEEACQLFDRCYDCPLYDMDIVPKCWKDPTGEAVLEWLESEVRDD